MPLSSDCFTLFFFFSSPPNNSCSWTQPWNEKTTQRNHSLTSRVCSPLRLLCFFGEWLKTTFTQLCTLVALTSEFWLSFYSFILLSLRLSLFHQTASWHTEHLVLCALCALHLIFIQKMKVDRMPSSITPCENPAESWLNGCIVGRLDMTQWYHSTEDSNLWIFASLHVPVFYSSSLSSSLKEALQLHPIRTRVPTFILAEFNYRLPFLPALIHPKPWTSFYHFS